MVCTVLPNDPTKPEDTDLAECGAAELRSLKTRTIAIETGIAGSATVPSGMIAMFSGAIPTGWVLCDGANGTPDLRDRFVVGSGPLHPINTTGGANQRTLTVEQMPSHTHTMNIYFGNTNDATRIGDKDNDSFQGTDNTGASGGGQPFDNQPAYWALYFAMKT